MPKQFSKESILLIVCIVIWNGEVLAFDEIVDCGISKYEKGSDTEKTVVATFDTQIKISEQLYVNGVVPSSFLSTSPAKKPNASKTWIIVLAIGSIIMLVVLIATFHKKLYRLICRNYQKLQKKNSSIKSSKQKEPTKLEVVIHELGPSGSLITCFEYEALRVATKNFHVKNKLGHGGFGTIYKGILADDTIVAVKKLEGNKAKNEDTEFLREVKLITSIQHRNLVRLTGCCSKEEERLLVYEYMSNGSLDRFLYGNNKEFLPWAIRLDIILGVARGLQYLHEDSHVRIVHRDIKASNILLDDKFQPKIADFGLARFFADEGCRSTTVAGTLGYTAPEYAIRGELSEKADIYSYGVLVLEIVSCRKNTDLTLPSEMQYLPELAWSLYEEGRILDLVDERMRAEGYPENAVMRAIEVAFRCIQASPHLRPAMSEVVAMFTCHSDMTLSCMQRGSGRMKMATRYNEFPTWDSITVDLTSPSFEMSISENARTPM